MTPISPQIVFRDAWLIVVEKPSGLLCQPGRGADLQDCLPARLPAELAAARIVHRLDRDTSGLMVLALDAETHRILSRQFEAREVEKIYEAVVWGRLADDAGRIELPLRKDLDHPPRHKVDPQLGKPAVTEWRVLQRREDRTRLELRPLTGRSHQLRVHLAHQGHPILGDPLYATPAVAALANRLQLHATGLGIIHPITGARITWTSPCPF